VLASRETPLNLWRIDHIVPTPWVSSPYSATSPDGGGKGTLRRMLGRHRKQFRRRSSPRPDRTVTGANCPDVTVRPSRGVHPPSGGGAASRTDGSPMIAGTSLLVRSQPSRLGRTVTSRYGYEEPGTSVFSGGHNGGRDTVYKSISPIYTILYINDR